MSTEHLLVPDSGDKEMQKTDEALFSRRYHFRNTKLTKYIYKDIHNMISYSGVIYAEETATLRDRQ